MPFVDTKREFDRLETFIALWHMVLTFWSRTTHNPNVSQEAKDHAREVIANELHGDEARRELYEARGDFDKSEVRVEAGLKASVFYPSNPSFSSLTWLTYLLYSSAEKNPRNTEWGKMHAAEKLDHLEQEDHRKK